MVRAIVKHRDDTDPIACPCGSVLRILTGEDNDLLSVHIVRISQDSKTHVHHRLTETYVVLDGEGTIELDGRREPLRSGTVVHIPPGVRHRAVGDLTVLNIVIPPFDPTDEHLVE